jgi:hypothetical protein
VRRASVFLVLLVAGCAGCSRALDDPGRWRAGQCRARFTIDHDDSPLAELRELGGWREGVQERFPAAVIDPEVQRPVTATAALRLEGRSIAWFSPALDAVVLDGAAFAPLRRADVTRAIAAGSGAAMATEAEVRQVVGRVVPRARQALGDRAVLELLLRVDAIQTYWHLGADLCLITEHAVDGAYRAELGGVHQLLGGHRGERKVEVPFAFVVEIDAEGLVSVVASAAPAATGRG